MSITTPGNSSQVIVVKEKKRRRWLTDVILRLLKEKPLGVLGAVIVLTLLLTGIFADFIAPYGMNESNLSAIRQPPSAQYWLGTDNLGRDMLSRIIFGARISMYIGLAGAALQVIVAVFIGLVSGFIGGIFDLIVQRFVDAFMCFPPLFIMLSAMALLGSGLLPVILVLGIYTGITSSRLVRSTVIGIKENVYVEASRAIGCTTRQMMVRHILPNIMAPIIIIFTIAMGYMILAEATLSFLGFGIPPPQPSWGGMLSGPARYQMYIAPWLAIWPGLALAIVVYGINMFGDAVRDILDPRLRGGLGHYGASGTKIRNKNKK